MKPSRILSLFQSSATAHWQSDITYVSYINNIIDARISASNKIKFYNYLKEF